MDISTTASRNPLEPMEVGSRIYSRHGPLPGPSIRLAANLDIDDVARCSSEPGIAVGDSDDVLMFVASPQAD